MPLVVRRLGLQEYEPIWKSMRYLAEQANSDRDDEIWLLSHKPVFTQGQAGKAEHILNPAEIPVVQIDRGGQVTYHGPGQLVVYLLLNVRRRKMGVRDLVDVIEQAIMQTLGEFGIAASNRAKAPGVYVNDAKIAALGLRIRKGWSYHGLSLNVQMDLEPFSRINPCGYENLAVTQVADHVPATDSLMQKVSKVLSNKLLSELGYLEYYESD
ncbi:MAG: octanoyltransferase [SAR86 cluster bacterium]|uniref:Octanoyltransferase n=1 Tax=SAR86 cluster bacterium TaxID=2030880 RepID=A0A2A4XCE4_9GAMM|nr:MAG: octanoyltransferase [SAR86 cluster bacterium]